MSHGKKCPILWKRSQKCHKCHREGGGRCQKAANSALCNLGAAIFDRPRDREIGHFLYFLLKLLLYCFSYSISSSCLPSVFSWSEHCRINRRLFMHYRLLYAMGERSRWFTKSLITLASIFPRIRNCRFSLMWCVYPFFLIKISVHVAC